jgi:hypothetical protein
VNACIVAVLRWTIVALENDENYTQILSGFSLSHGYLKLNDPTMIRHGCYALEPGNLGAVPRAFDLCHGYLHAGGITYNDSCAVPVYT